MNFAKFLRAPTLRKIYKRLLLYVFRLLDIKLQKNLLVSELLIYIELIMSRGIKTEEMFLIRLQIQNKIRYNF